MVAHCGATCAKYLLCLFNFTFFVVGSAVLFVGVWLAVDKTSFIHLSKFGFPESQEFGNSGLLHELTEPTVIEQGAYILIAAGAFIFIISFLGYCGAIKESRVLLTAYGLFIIIIALLQITAIALTVLYKDHAEQKTKEFFTFTIDEYYTTEAKRDAVTLTWDFMQAELECCGVHGAKDFETAQKFQDYVKEENTGQMIPKTCCKLKKPLKYSLDSVKDLFIPEDDNCPGTFTVTNSYMKKGCYQAVEDLIISNVSIVVGVASGVLGLQILGIIFAFCLCKAIGNDRDYHYKY